MGYFGSWARSREASPREPQDRSEQPREPVCPSGLERQPRRYWAEVDDQARDLVVAVFADGAFVDRALRQLHPIIVAWAVKERGPIGVHFRVRLGATMFETELNFFIQHQADLVAKHRGKILTIRGAEVVAVHQTTLEAYLAAQKKYAPGSVMIQRCEPGREAYTITVTRLDFGV